MAPDHSRGTRFPINPPRKPSDRPKTDQEEKIEFLVGPNSKSYKVAKKAIVSKSPYLASLPKSRDGTVRVKNLGPTQFEAAVLWITKRKLSSELVDSNGVMTSRFRSNIQYHYAIAWKLELHDMQNHIMDLIWSCFARNKRSHRKLSSLARCIEKGLTDTPLYMFTLRSGIYAYMNKRKEEDSAWKTDLDKLEKSPQAMIDVISHIGKWVNAPWTRPGLDDRCNYHNHPDGKKCEHDPEIDDVLTTFGSGPGQPDDEDDSESELLDEAQVNGNGGAGDRAQDSDRRRGVAQFPLRQRDVR